MDFGAKVELAAASFLETGKLFAIRLNAKARRVWRVKGAAERSPESTQSLGDIKVLRDILVNLATLRSSGPQSVRSHVF